MRPASPSAWWSPTRSTARMPTWKPSCSPRKIPYVMGLRALAWHVAAGRRSRQPTGFHPSRSRRAPAPGRLGAHRALRQPWQGARALRRRTRAGTELWPDHERAPDRRHPGSRHLKPESTWYLVTSLPLAQVSAEQVYEIYRLRDWIEHYYKPVKHELGWADYQMRPERAIVRHWQLVMLAFTFSLLVGALPEGAPARWTPRSGCRGAIPDADMPQSVPAGGKIRTTQRPRPVRGAGRVERDPAAGAGLALPLGAAAALLEALVVRRPTARAGRAPRPRRPLPPT